MYPDLPGLRVMLCCLLLVSLQTAAAVESLTGRPARIVSGNELVLLGSDGVLHRIVLSGIDTQPPNQPWGAAAIRHLRSLVMGRSVTFLYRSTEHTERIRGQLRHGGADINIRLLAAGLARLDPSGLSRADTERYAAAERQARAAGLGIWSTAGREPRFQSRTPPGGALFRTQQ